MHTRSLRSTLVLALIAGLVMAGASEGAAKISFTPKTPGQSHPKRDPCNVQVFQDTKPDRTYTTLGIVNYHDERHRSQAGSHTLEAALPDIKAEACKVGADALMNIRVTSVKRLEAALFNVSATAIRFDADEAPTPGGGR